MLPSFHLPHTPCPTVPGCGAAVGFPSNCGGEATLDAILTLGTARAYEQLQRTSGRDLGFEPLPCLAVAQTAAELRHAEQQVRALKALGYRHFQHH